MTRRATIIRAAVFVLFAAGLGIAALRLRGRKALPPPVPSEGPPKYRTRSTIEVAEVVLDRALGKGWEDWGWGAHELPDGGALTADLGAYGGVIFHHGELASNYGALVFRYHTSAPYPNLLRVAIKSGQVDEKVLPQVEVGVSETAVLDDGWYEVMIPWAALNPGGVPFDRIVIQARRFFEREMVKFDKIVLTKRDPRAPVAAAGAKKVPLAVHCDRSAIKISPLIYGTSGNVWTTNATARRMGGNPTTRLNWDNGFYNTGNDWYFENVKGAPPSNWIAEDLAHHVKTAIVVPMIGWVAKDDSSFGFPVSKFGPEQATDPYKPEAGNGKGKDGKLIVPDGPEQTSTAAPPELIRKWIQFIRIGDRASGVRSVDMYILDNEPNLWSSTHRDVHPDPLSYDELLDRTVRYATAIREADPEAVIAGPAEWGWTGYFYSAKDLVHGSFLHLDRRLHGNTPLLEWYLKKLHDYEASHGVRLLDVVDVHYYPQAAGIYGGNARTDREGSALRLRSTRAMWDPEYKDESWIGEAVRLIPRLKEWVSENYPGLGISIGEWNFGAEQHMSGGLAVAEVLGRFGQQGITSAFYWTAPAEGTPAFQAFRAYRNFDGKGASFLDWSVPTTEAPGISLFASRDDDGTHVVAVLLNTQPDTLAEAEIDVSSCGRVASNRVFEYRDGAAGFVGVDAASGDAGKREDKGVVRERLEPYSIKVLSLTILKHPAQ